MFNEWKKRKKDHISGMAGAGLSRNVNSSRKPSRSASRSADRAGLVVDKPTARDDDGGAAGALRGRGRSTARVKVGR